MSNIETFNLIAGLILADLYEHFPKPISIGAGDIAKRAGLCANPEDPTWQEEELPDAVVEWLKDEGFIRTGSGSMSPIYHHQVVLSHSGLRLLSVPGVLHSNESVGAGLAKAAKDGANQGVSELVKVALVEGGKALFQATVLAAIQAAAR